MPCWAALCVAKAAVDPAIAALAETIESFESNLSRLNLADNLDTQVAALRLKARMVESHSKVQARDLEKRAKQLDDINKAQLQKQRDGVIRDRLKQAQARERPSAHVGLDYQSYYSDEAIFQAANDGDMATLIELLSNAQVDVNRKDADGYSTAFSTSRSTQLYRV